MGRSLEDAFRRLVDYNKVLYSHIFKEPDDRLYEGDERICTNMQDTTEVPYRMNNTDDELLKSARTIMSKIIANLKEATCVQLTKYYTTQCTWKPSADLI